MPGPWRARKQAAPVFMAELWGETGWYIQRGGGGEGEKRERRIEWNNSPFLFMVLSFFLKKEPVTIMSPYTRPSPTRLFSTIPLLSFTPWTSNVVYTCTLTIYYHPIPFPHPSRRPVLLAFMQHGVCVCVCVFKRRPLCSPKHFSIIKLEQKPFMQSTIYPHRRHCIAHQ